MITIHIESDGKKTHDESLFEQAFKVANEFHFGSRPFFVICILSDIQEAIVRKDKKLLEKWTYEAEYNLKRALEVHQIDGITHSNVQSWVHNSASAIKCSDYDTANECLNQAKRILSPLARKAMRI